MISRCIDSTTEKYMIMSSSNTLFLLYRLLQELAAFASRSRYGFRMEMYVNVKLKVLEHLAMQLSSVMMRQILMQPKR